MFSIFSPVGFHQGLSVLCFKHLFMTSDHKKLESQEFHDNFL